MKSNPTFPVFPGRAVFPHTASAGERADCISRVEGAWLQQDITVVNAGPDETVILSLPVTNFVAGERLLISANLSGLVNAPTQYSLRLDGVLVFGSVFSGSGDVMSGMLQVLTDPLAEGVHLVELIIHEGDIVINAASNRLFHFATMQALGVSC